MVKIKLRGTKYPAIQAWGEMMVSNQSYIDAQIALAVRDNAPELAIFRQDDSDKWHTLDEVANPQTQWWFKANKPELAEKAGFA